jgi:hypothetical protein
MSGAAAASCADSTRETGVACEAPAGRGSGASWQTPWVALIVQQRPGHAPPAIEAGMGQSAPMPFMLIGHPGAHGAGAPTAQGSAAIAGCRASSAIARSAANWASRFICWNSSYKAGGGGGCVLNHTSAARLRSAGIESAGRRSSNRCCARRLISSVSRAKLAESYGIRRSVLCGSVVSAATGTSMSSLRMTRLVALSVASSNPWPCVIASVGQASTQ